MNPTRMDRLDFLSSIVLILFAGGVLIESYRMERLEHLNVEPYTAPAVVPGLLGCLLLLCGVALLIRSVSRGGWRLGDLLKEAVTGLTDETFRRVGLTILLTFGFALGLFGWLPFGIAAAIFIIAFILLMSPREERDAFNRLKQIGGALAIALIAGFGIAFVFTKIFLVKLP